MVDPEDLSREERRQLADEWAQEKMAYVEEELLPYADRVGAYLREAIDTVFDEDGDIAYLLAGFKDAYEFRSEYEWLPESEENGLFYAAHGALWNYLDPHDFPPERPDMEPLDDERFADQLQQAFTDALENIEEGDEDRLLQFLRHLDRQSDQPIAELGSEDYEIHIKAALHQYHRDKKTGLSQDPVP